MGASEQGIDPKGRWLTITRALCFVTHQTDVLLIRRNVNRKSFAGHYNGVGGHVEQGEDVLTGARREILEESGLLIPADQIILRGVISIDAGKVNGVTLFIFTAAVESREGTFSECSEGTLHWTPLGEVLTLSVIDDLPIFWPRLFGDKQSDRPFFAHASYDSDDQMVMRFTDEE